MLWFTKDLTDESYRKLMRYAVSKSDAFMLAYQYTHCQGECRKKLESFQDQFAPFLIKRREGDEGNYWVNTTRGCCSSRRPDKRNCVEVYRACPDVLPILYEADRLFIWDEDFGYPTDTAFFNQNACWFFTTCHEGVAVFSRADEENIAFMDSLGIEYFKDDEENPPFREDYTI